MDLTSATLKERTQKFFAQNGPLAAALEGYQLREEQLTMAEAVAETLEQRQQLIVEAGTGTGKSLAYLVPALLSAGKVIVSTGTKNLQDQLFQKDLPLLMGLAKHPVTISLLKGRANYLCLHRLKQALADPRMHQRRRDQTESPWLALRSVQEWGLQSEDGDIHAGDAPKVDAVPLVRITSTTENCLGSECPEYSECFVIKARRRAQEADLVVVNHHLLLADLALREEGFTELLPSADAVILDEAHQLPQVATQFFGRRYSFYQLSDIARDIRAELRDIAGDMPGLRDAVGVYEEACANMQQRLRGFQRRYSWSDTVREAGIAEAVEQLSEALKNLVNAIEPARVRSKGLEQAGRRLGDLKQFFVDLSTDEGDLIRWVERGERSFIIHLTPIDVADNFRQIMQASNAAWIMTSATLSVDHEFSHFVSQVGADSAKTLILESPFDYQANALMYLPGLRYEPNHPGYTENLAETILPVIENYGGGAFVLCTSLQAVSQLAQYLRAHLKLSVYAQGDASKHALLEKFSADGNAVLVGTSSFWEGVDVRGRALRLVIIDRLPFAHPGDPVMKARLDTIKSAGGSPFFDYQIPQAVISLKQGVGRLIRDTQDRGVVMLCDPRIQSKGYGNTFLSSLPAMPQTQSVAEVNAFIECEPST